MEVPTLVECSAAQRTGERRPPLLLPTDSRARESISTIYNVLGICFQDRPVSKLRMCTLLFMLSRLPSQEHQGPLRVWHRSWLEAPLKSYRCCMRRDEEESEPLWHTRLLSRTNFVQIRRGPCRMLGCRRCMRAPLHVRSILTPSARPAVHARRMSVHHTLFSRSASRRFTVCACL